MVLILTLTLILQWLFQVYLAVHKARNLKMPHKDSQMQSAVDQTLKKFKLPPFVGVKKTVHRTSPDSPHFIKPVSSAQKGRNVGDVEGPDILVAIVGQKGARWSTFYAKHLAIFIDPLIAKLSVNPMNHSACIDDDTLFGFALLQSWSVVTESSDPIARKMFHTLKADGRRRVSPIFLQHRIRMSMQLITPLPIVADGGDSIALWHHCSNLAMRTLWHSDNRRTQVSGTSELTHFLRSSNCSVYLWPVFHPMAIAFCAGFLSFDFSLLPMRDKIPLPGKWRQPVLPDEAALKRMRSFAGIAAIPTPMSVPRYPRGFIQTPAKDPCVKLQEVRVSFDLTSSYVDMDNHMDHVYVLGDMLNGNSNETIVRPHRAVSAMKKAERNRSIVRTDIASMLAHRELYRLHGPYFRYSTFCGFTFLFGWILILRGGLVASQGGYISKQHHPPPPDGLWSLCCLKRATHTFAFFCMNMAPPE